MIGYFGDIIFETNDKRILTFNEFTRSISARYGKHEIINRKPKLEYMGPDTSVVTFSIRLDSSHGVDPRTMMNKLQVICEMGKEQTLAIGGAKMGWNKWVLTSVSQAWNVVTAKGKVQKASVELQLEEYV